MTGTPDTDPQFDRRPWGSFQVLEDRDRYKVKRLTVDPGQRLSYQKHAHRTEHWVVVEGFALITLDGQPHELTVGQAIDIPLGAAHRVENPGDAELVFVEVQTGDYFGEDDIERLDDDYGRARAEEDDEGEQMDFELSPVASDLRERLLAFMDDAVYPAEAVYRDQMGASGDDHFHPPIIEELKREARKRGLWNLFLPHKTEWTDGLSNLDYAPLAEISGRSGLAPEAMNCAAPDTGNMEILTMFGTTEQKERWLQPLLEGEIRSCFAMTEPAVASSDATNIECSIRRDGDEYVINGRKWWISGAASKHCRIAIVMGKTDPDAPTHLQQSMILVPLDTPGMNIVRALPVFGYQDREGHCEIEFDDARVPAANILGEEGGGFAIAQARLGPGRIHHCMRCIGMAERALEAMCRRVRGRTAFGKTLAEQGVIQEWIADSRMEIDQARLLTLHAAWLMDTVGNKGARTEVSEIKVVAPNVALRVVDRAIQAHGAAGVSNDFPLAAMYAGLRTLRLADGPDEVHRMVIARRELRKYEDSQTK